jgi:hypothetical protein
VDHSLARERDPRDRASAWIKGNIPEHSVVGLEYEANYMAPGHLYMQFWKGNLYPAPLVQGPDYAITIWNQDQEAWPSNMTYWVHSGLFYSNHARKDPDVRERDLRIKAKMERGFRPVQVFQRDLRWGPLHYTFPDLAGWDWFIFFPTITAYERVHAA